MHNLEKHNLYKNQPIQINYFIKNASRFLIDNDILNAKNEIEWFLQDLCKCDKIELYNSKLDIEKHNHCIDFLLKRVEKIPFQYLIGKSSFYGRDFKVNKNVLIPRPETELLIEIIKNSKYNKLLEIGTGCGCIAITARLENIANKIDALDISESILKVAHMNALLLNAPKINFIKLNILEEAPNNSYDIIISNPPYISKIEYKDLNKEIQHEPINALTDFADGLIFYERYAKILKKLLKPKGVAVFELSHSFQKKQIIDIFSNYSNLQFFNDLNKDCRAVKITND